MGPPQVNRITLHNETLPTFSFVYSTMAAANLLGSSPDTVTTPGCFPRYCRIPMICSFLLQPKCYIVYPFSSCVTKFAKMGKICNIFNLCQSFFLQFYKFLTEINTDYNFYAFNILKFKRDPQKSEN